MGNKTIKFIGYNLLVVLILFSILEGIFSWYLHHPERIPERHVKVFRLYYLQYLRDIIQFNPDFARFDSTYFYRWEPGTAKQHEVEFKVTHQFNSAGFRDEEAALQRPEILFLGDSYTMGWGVEQAESFPALVEQQTGWTTLNMGVSSYGTVRELSRIPEIDTSALRCIVLQYCSNDLKENTNYKINQGVLKVSDAAFYREKVCQNKAERGYSLFQHTIKLLPVFLKGKFGQTTAVTFTKETPETPPLLALLYVLQQFKDQLPDVPILIFELSEPGWEDGAIQELDQVLQDGGLRNQLPDLRVVYPEKSLTADDRYLLDLHLKPSGHQKIAEGLIPVLTATLSSQ
ncbi:MAG: GDSL-type esterase/lipase family protein [Bacteroidota bacterium]